MDPIKEAFDKIKQDIFSLKLEINSIKQLVSEIKNENNKNNEKFNDFMQKTSQQAVNPAIPAHNPTNNHPLISTPAHNPTIPAPPYSPINQNITSSTGNRGVPADTSTDRQTYQQTDQQTQNTLNFIQNPVFQTQNHDFERAKELLDSLDSIKKEIRLKFKRLTPQEMQLFSTLYALEDQNIEEITYKVLAQQLRLTESSIRDYTTKLIQKGIPLLKIRQNNKKIVLKISPDLQKVASLSTIIKLREL